MNRLIRRYQQRLYLLGLLAMVCGSVWIGSAQAQSANPFAVFLPIVANSSDGGGGGGGGGGGNPNSDNFVERELKTSSQNIAVDARGGTHLAYYHHPRDNEIYKLVYAYCPAPVRTCNQPNRWKRVELDRVVEQVQLALTRDGRPRILTRAYDNFPYRSFAYGECDGDCLNAASWHFAEGVAGIQVDARTELYASVKPMHYFALDAQDRPRFVFNNNARTSIDDRTFERGGNYAQCDADCTNVQNWTATRFTHSYTSDYEYQYDDEFVYPALAFTSQGEPRVVAHLTYTIVDGESTGLYYFGCDANCEDDASWERAKIAERGTGINAVWDLAVDSNNQPHVAYYEEPEIGTTNNQLYYLSCASDCERGGAWNTLNFGLPSGAGDGVDIALDNQGRPRMAYLDAADNLAYSWCNVTCEGAASWQHTIVEARGLLDTEYPIGTLPLCTGGFWNTMATSLALDPQGEPRVAYRGIFQEKCFIDDPGKPGEPPTFNFRDVWHSIRITVFQQP